MTKPKVGRASAAETDLKSALERFRKNPFRKSAIKAWFNALAEHCPLWALKTDAYKEFGGFPTADARLPAAWAAMAWPTLDLGPDIWEMSTPEAVTLYFVNQYRTNLLFHANPTSHLQARVWGSRSDANALRELAPQLAVRLQKLMWLVAKRDLAPKGERRKAQYLLDEFLKRFGITARNFRPSIPKGRQFVKAATTEALAWLGAEQATRYTKLSAAAQRKVEELYPDEFEDQPIDDYIRFSVHRLAFPFLHRLECGYMLQQSSLSNATIKLLAVHLFQHRLQGFYNPVTVARYAFGTRFIDAFGKETISDNPLEHAVKLYSPV